MHVGSAAICASHFRFTGILCLPLVLLLAVSGFAAPAADAPDRELRSAQQFAKVRARAEAGSTHDQFLMGYAFARGLQEPQDMAQALNWYTLAADRGDPGAITELGRMYALGLGVKQNYQQALNWFRRAASEGYPAAQTDLGLMYSRGLGVKQDPQAAVLWWRDAAGQ
ncbi:MAG TPA: tetratricopeptide repeat protein, partial [Terriglobia bacterium]|nr:tetratricopeptide repeat protein [Terriglobia bacterium]